MKFEIDAQHIISGKINLPTSKSISNRLLLLNALCHSKSLPHNLSDSDDTKVMLAALQSDLKEINVGAAGTSMRFMTAYLSSVDGTHIITGSERMKQRPIKILVDALRALGAKISYVENEGYPPLAIEGCKLNGNRLTLPGNVSSQYISALMMIAPTIDGGLTITLEGKIISKPYLNMTMRLMQAFGASPKWNGNNIEIPQCNYTHYNTEVEADWSAASYWYSIAALMPQNRYELIGLKQDSSQGDSKVVEIAKELGVNTTFTDNGVIIERTSKPTDNFSYDFNFQPDLAQTFVVLCCVMNVKFTFTGLESLKIKETDRIAALIDEARKLGYTLETNGIDSLSWNGDMTTPDSEITISTYKDHRMAMAFAPASIAKGKIIIDDPMVVTKSYPEFWSDLKSVGVMVKEL